MTKGSTCFPKKNYDLGGAIAEFVDRQLKVI